MVQATTRPGLNRLVTARIWYFRPRQDVDAGPLIVQPELIGEQPTVMNHSGLLQDFLWQRYDTCDEDTKLTFKMQSLMHDFTAAAASMTPEERLQMMADYKARNPTVAAILPVAMTRSGEKISVVPDEKKISAADAFKALVPYPKLRAFLDFWQREIEGPLHSVEHSAGRLFTSNAIAKKDFFTLH